MARNIGMDYSDFKAMNPAYRKSISPVTGVSTAYVPAAHGARAAAWLALPQARRFAGWQHYKVRRGDNLSSLSQRYGISVPVLSQANNLAGKILREGSVLLVPSANAASSGREGGTAASAKGLRGGSGNASASALSASADKADGRQIHTVRRGENFYRIAMNYGISLASLLEANGVSAKDSHLMAGQKLVIPAAGPAAAGKSGAVYVVQQGDTLYSLAQRNKISLDKLLRINSLDPGVIILPGQEILLP
jgi:membrane-bound lytic murein transglycosylase D